MPYLLRDSFPGGPSKDLIGAISLVLGRALRGQHFMIVSGLNDELANIGQIQENQARLATVASSAALAVFIGATSFVGHVAHDAFGMEERVS